MFRVAEWEEKLGAILNNPQAMGQIMELAKSIGGGEEKPATPSAPAAPEPEPSSAGSGIDPRLMEVGMRALAAYQDADDRKTTLLQALRPFVREERYKKVDKAIQIARMSKAVRAALDGLKGGENPV